MASMTRKRSGTSTPSAPVPVQKTKTRKRKTFDTTDHDLFEKMGAGARKKSTSSASEATDEQKSDWRRKDKDSVVARRAGKKMRAGRAKDGKPSPPAPEKPDPDQTDEERHVAEGEAREPWRSGIPQDYWRSLQPDRRMSSRRKAPPLISA